MIDHGVHNSVQVRAVLDCVAQGSETNEISALGVLASGFDQDALGEGPVYKEFSLTEAPNPVD